MHVDPLSIVNKMAFLLASILGIVAGILALVVKPTPIWVLILVMISALLFIVTFGSVLLQRNPAPTRTLTVGLILFCVGSYGEFTSALEAYLLDPAKPYFAFLRIALIASIFLVVGSLFLIYDILFVPQPGMLSVMFFIISMGTASLFASSLLSYLGVILAGRILSVVAFGFFLLASLVNVTL